MRLFHRILFLVLYVLIAALEVARATVHILDDANFDDFADSLRYDQLLLVDFYKPGCRHCQRLSAVLDYLDKAWEEEDVDPDKRWFQLAKVDASKNERLATAFGLSRFPDLRFVRAGQWSTYEGKTKIEDLQEFKDRMAIIPLPALDTDNLKEVVDSDGVAFVLVTETGSDAASEAPGVSLAATGLQHVATFGTMTRDAVSSIGLDNEALPALVKVVTGPEGLQSLVFGGDLRSASYLAITRWIERENHPLVGEFSPNNFSRLGSVGKLMVIGIVDPKAGETPAFKSAMLTVASGIGLNHADKLVFGTIDGIKLAGFAETLNVFDGLPRVVVMDTARDSFYSAPADSKMGVVEMEAFLFNVLAGELPLTRSSSDTVRMMMKLWWAIRNGGKWSLVLILPMMGLLWVLIDTPAWEEQRAAAREAKRAEKEEAEAARLKQD